MASISTHGRAGRQKSTPPDPSTPPPKTLSAAELLEAAAKPRGKKRPKNPFDYDGDLEDLAATILRLTRQQAEIERELKLAQTALRQAVDPWYRERLARHGYEATVRVPAGGEGTVRLTYQHRYLKTPASHVSAIRDIVGAAYEEFFQNAVSLKVRKEVAEDPTRLAAVVVQLGQVLGHDFAAIFEAEQTIQPTRAFTEQRYRQLDAEANARLEVLGLRQVVAVGEGK